MLGICELCGYRGSQVIYELTTEHELCFRCYDNQETAFQNNRTELKSQHSPKAA